MRRKPPTAGKIVAWTRQALARARAWGFKEDDHVH